MNTITHFQTPALMLSSLLLFFSSAHAQTHSKQETANIKLVTAGFEAWRTGTGSFFDLLDDNMQWEITGSTPYSKIYTSKKQLMDEVLIPLNKKLKEKITPTVRSIYADGDMVIALWDGKAIALDDKEYRSSYSWYMQMTKGKIIKVVAFLDGIEFANIMERIKID